ncbi:hypothetical protein DRE_07768 [Drechslerella stenobrocha 248]|uniref:Uncharacterized protein n=1 Tax=Drechslerella stenobrocha 248 TaxID=1043628 RepID=W7IGJ4_9PEZI|nr:hypothetical protein DRE_07768 [Drechslerella stenobrocha 248]
MARLPSKAFFAKVVPLWPKDPFRPGIDFPQLLRSRIESDFGDAPPPPPFRPKNEDGLTPPIIKLAHTPASAEAQWGVIQSLVSNRYQKRYPVKRLTEPGFNPEYYKKLITELDEAPKRNWLSAYLHTWKGFIRWHD